MACMYVLGEPACGGVLVHPEWVLTASHCLFDNDLSIFNIRVNSVNAYGELNPNGGEQRDIAEVHVHPGYNFDELIGEYVDLMLFRLSSPIAGITPIALPVSQNVDELYQSWNEMHLAGWGLVVNEEEGYIPDILQWVVSTVYDFDICEVSVGHEISDDFFCIGYTSGQTPSGAATGDSGGPSWIYDAEGNAVLTGIVHGAMWFYTSMDEPGLFVKVANQLNWINEVINGPPSSTLAASAKPVIRLASHSGKIKLFVEAYTGQLEVSLWSIQGVKLLHTRTYVSPGSPAIVDADQLSSGCYIAQVTTVSGMVMSEKVVVQH